MKKVTIGQHRHFVQTKCERVRLTLSPVCVQTPDTFAAPIPARQGPGSVHRRPEQTGRLQPGQRSSLTTHYSVLIYACKGADILEETGLSVRVQACSLTFDPFSSTLYRNLCLTLVSSNFPPKRECSPRGAN